MLRYNQQRTGPSLCVADARAWIGRATNRFRRKFSLLPETGNRGRRSVRKADVDRERAANPKLPLPDHVCRLDPVQSCRR